MTFALGTLSLVQVAVLPGLILVRLLGISGFLKSVVLSFPLSLLFNFVLGVSLTAFGVYRPLSVYVLFGAELALLAWLFRHEWTRRIFPVAPKDPRTLTMHHVLMVIAVLFLAGLLFRTFLLTGRTLEGWDPIVSWNHWAQEWAMNDFPRHIWHYPQLIPVNWSMSYQFMMNTELQYFARALMLVIPSFTFLIGLHLFATTRNPAYFIAPILVPGIMWRCLGDLSASTTGWVDPAVAFMGLACVAVLAETDDSRTDLVVGSLLGSAAAVTKQAGLIVLVAYIAISIARLVSRRRLTAQNLAVLLVPPLLIVIPWYAFMEWRILRGLDTSEVAYVTHGIYKGVGIPDRMASAFARLFAVFHGWLFLGPGLALFVLGFFSRDTSRHNWNAIHLLITIPYTLLWAAFFSYDFRNLSVALPLWGYGIARGAALLANPVLMRLEAILAARRPTPAWPRWLPLVPRLRYWHVPALVLGLTLAIAPAFPYSALLARHIDFQYGNDTNQELSDALRRLIASPCFAGQIISAYDYHPYLPGYSRRVVAWNAVADDLVRGRLTGGMQLLLLPVNASEQMQDALAQLSSMTQLTVVFDRGGYRLYEIQTTRCSGSEFAS